MDNSEGSERIDLGFSEALDSALVDDWSPKPKPAPSFVAAAAAQSGFRSREARERVVGEVEPVAVANKVTRGRRTGRNAQINIKAKPETIERLYGISDRTGFSIAELFEKAVTILEMQSAL